MSTSAESLSFFAEKGMKVEPGAMSQPVALTIAGSDPTGGAGLQADLKVFAAHKVHGASVTTVLTAQNAERFQPMPVPASFIKAQAEAVFEAFDIRAVKIGMLAEAEAIALAADLLAPRAQAGLPLVLDPILRTSTQAETLDEEAMILLRRHLIPLCALIKPNLLEAGRLLECPPAGSIEQMKAQAERLLALGCGHVYLSGGHLPDEKSVDILASRDGVTELAGERRPHLDVHGSGCTLTAAIAAQLAGGAEMITAARMAKDYINRLYAGDPQQDRQGRPISFRHLGG